MLFTLYCRAYQTILRAGSYALPWREPERIEGMGSLKRLPARLKELGVKRLLLVSGRTTSKLPSFLELVETLSRSGIEGFIYDKTVPNPSVQNVLEARDLYVLQGCDAILAFGGGSPMDCAKAVGALLARPSAKLHELRGVLKVRRNPPLLIAIPTTAGTGSETTVAAVISDHDAQEKYAISDPVLIPRLAVLDPELTADLPPAITASTGMDALTHAVEAYIGRSNTRQSAAAARKACLLIFSNLEKAYNEGHDFEARAAMLEASYLAGVAFTRAYVGYVHALAHALGGRYGIAHGLANAVLLPYVLEAYGKSAEKALALLARESGICSADADVPSAAKALIQRIREMNARMGMGQSLEGIRAEDITALARHAFDEANPLYPVPRILGVKDLEAILRRVAV